MALLLRHLLLLTALLCLLPLPGRAQVSGSASWNWTEFARDYKESGEELDASSFMQSYSLLYEARGTFAGGAAGGWKGALGYQWSALDAEINDASETIRDGKLLYRGDMTFAPGGLPFRLNAYSYDLTSAAPTRYGEEYVIAPDIALSLTGSGQYIVSGVTLLAGITNGSYLGQYRELLAKLPRLLVDYRQTYSRNVDGLNPEHYLLRDLAFVSLNKKDNWFHYRVSEFEDFEDPDQNYRSNTYMIGTVDQTLARQWINLTNWIKLSADGSLVKDFYSGANQARDAEEYRLNLFTRATRKAWQGSSFISFGRARENAGTTVRKTLDLPFYAVGQFDPRTRWRASVVHTSEENSNAGIEGLSEHNLFLTGQLVSERASGRLLTADLELENNIDRVGDDSGRAAKLAFELRTDARRNEPISWLAGGSQAWFSHPDSSSTYLETEAFVSLDHRASPALGYGGTQRLTVGFGEYVPAATNYLQPVLATSFGNREGYQDIAIAEGSSFRSQTSAYLELLGPSRWKQRFDAGFDYIDRGGEKTHLLSLSHNAGFYANNLTLQLNTAFESGDQVEFYTGLDQDGVGSIESIVGEADYTLASVLNVDYRPHHAWLTHGEASLMLGKGDLGQAGVVHLGQSAVYTLNGSTGLRRKVASLEQRAVYEYLWADDAEADGRWYASLEMVGRWHPLTWMTLAGRAEYGRMSALADSNLYAYGMEATLSFAKFEVALSYEYGETSDIWENRAAVREQRWEVDIKKTF